MQFRRVLIVISILLSLKSSIFIQPLYKRDVRYLGTFGGGGGVGFLYVGVCAPLRWSKFVLGVELFGVPVRLLFEVLLIFPPHAKYLKYSSVKSSAWVLIFSRSGNASSLK